MYEARKQIVELLRAYKGPQCAFVEKDTNGAVCAIGVILDHLVTMGYGYWVKQGPGLRAGFVFRRDCLSLDKIHPLEKEMVSKISEDDIRKAISEDDIQKAFPGSILVESNLAYMMTYLNDYMDSTFLEIANWIEAINTPACPQEN